MSLPSLLLLKISLQKQLLLTVWCVSFHTLSVHAKIRLCVCVYIYSYMCVCVCNYVYVVIYSDVPSKHHFSDS